MAKCLHCGKEFLNTRGNRKYCSKLCCLQYHRDGKEVFERVCEICDSHFYTTDPRKKYCTTKCNEVAQNKKRKTTKLEYRSCPQCGKRFQPKQKRGKGRSYCSEKCRRKASYERNKPNKLTKAKEEAKKYKWDGNWWKALQRDEFTCQLCGLRSWPSQWKGKKRLIVHHKDGSGEAKSKNHSLDNLMTVCQPCHNQFHGLHLIVEDGKYKVAGKIFEHISLDSVEVTSLPEK